MYRDMNLVENIFEACDSIIQSDPLIHDSLLFQYSLAQIYYELSNNRTLEAYKIILDLEEDSHQSYISRKPRSAYNYINAFTIMSLGDLESAQKVYYNNVEFGKSTQDTATILMNLYSLGQLYNDEEESDAAIKCYQEILNMGKFNDRVSTHALTMFELSEAYLNKGNYKDALESINKGLELIQEHDLQVLKPDMLVQKGEIFIATKDFDSAELIRKEISSIDKKDINSSHFGEITLFYANLHASKKEHEKIIPLATSIIDTDGIKNSIKLSAYTKLHTAYHNMTRYDSAYHYLNEHNTLLEQNLKDEKLQKTNYLKIKYDSDQKEKDNELLSVKLIKNENFQKLLLILMGFFGLMISFLIAAYYQKIKYNKKLESEVQKRTVHLQQSNDLLKSSYKDIEEFNRILSHDLKEPVRNIVSFSQLTRKKLSEDSQFIDHIDIITNSGKQLSALIEEVNVYRNNVSNDLNTMTHFNISKLMNDVLSKVRQKYLKKNIQLKINNTGMIKSHLDSLEIIMNKIFDNASLFNDNDEVLIDVTYSLSENTHNFWIADNGIGIDPQYHDTIFQSFTRLNNRDAYTGSGLSLSIVKSLTNRLGGEIYITDSDSLTGTCFKIELPANPINYYSQN
jgi:signal transduction histidine kinase